VSPNTPSLLNVADNRSQSKRQQCIAPPLSKDEVRSGQGFMNSEKFSSLRHCLPTGCGDATEQFYFVAIWNSDHLRSRYNRYKVPRENSRNALA
jgi:hypothetical protein